MKRILFATALLGATLVSASAADMGARYTKAPPMMAPVYNWTGFYIGAHIGGAFRDNDGIGIAGFASNDNRGAFLGGGQVGADYQFSPNWLVGIEGQFSGVSRDDNRSFTNVAGAGFRDRSDWLASVTGRVGYVWGPALIYAKGGVAFREDNRLSAFTAGGGATPFTTNRDETGYTVGGGGEYMFAPSWSAKIEYQYYNFDRTNVTVAALGAPFTTGVSYRDDIHTVKLGVNYHFNWGGPTMSKY